MKKVKIFLLLLLTCICFCNFNYVEASANVKKYYLGGYSAGFSLDTRGASIVGICDIVNLCDVYSPAKDAQIEVGDVILSIDGRNVNNACDVAECIKDGGEKLLKVKRDDICYFTKINFLKERFSSIERCL